MELSDISELIKITSEKNDASLISQLLLDSKKLLKKSESARYLNLLNEEADQFNCFIEIHAGAGGTESQDWAAMLQRMYLRWSERKNMKSTLLQESRAEEAGIKSATMKIIGDYSYGWLKRESGIHRLVRISPFDSNKRRHTSFASVWVYPEVDDKIEIEISESDLRIDTYRASGAGGQHVNKTESAIRITHIPTNLIVTCQDESSQHKNRDKAMKVLRARLFDLETEKLNKKRSDTRKEMVSTGDRSAKIRTYNYPQGRVTDHRINLTLYKLDEVMDGNIICLIEPLQLEDQKNKLEHIAE